MFRSWKHVTTLLVIPLAIATGVAVTPAAQAATSSAATSTEFSFVSAAGDSIAQGQSEDFTSPPATITPTGDAGDITMNVVSGSENWTVDIAAPRGRVLEPGRYLDAERAGTRTGLSPGLVVSGDGRGCGYIYGSFTINQIGTDGRGDVTMLDATFTQRCGSPSAPALHGTVLFAATPLSYRFTSNAGDYIGGGNHQTYHGDTSTFTLSGEAADARFTVSGLRDTWNATFIAPVGQTLHVGSYPHARALRSLKHPGMNVNGDGRACSETSGEFTVTAIEYSGTQLVSFAATFIQHCDGAVPALHGSIHFEA